MRELRGRDEDRLVDPTRQRDSAFGPTRLFGKLNGAFGPTRPFGELDGAFGPTRRASWTIEPYRCFVVSILRIRLSEDSSNLSRWLIV
ncbi:hypothetical protein F2Q70_00002846 [Brassica cretica]|uniref:Uncharacterized protein n=1 Tax=Brassica cretica TaxID=69181 RepID=A0A8S9IW98_BRACR|nr:hypothetical protein F2Q70_00002846 [Brassica cretica]KAF3563111.1 hypothetical protein DY000_02014490 [Brassica cretica]